MSFKILKSTEIVNLKGVGSELQIKMCLPRQSLTKDCRQIYEINKICFSMEGFLAEFSRLFSGNVKISFLGGRLGTCQQIQAFQGFS